jgi:hypothetical protein
MVDLQPRPLLLLLTPTLVELLADGGGTPRAS